MSLLRTLGVLLRGLTRGLLGVLLGLAARLALAAVPAELGADEHDDEEQRRDGDAEPREQHERPADAHRLDHQVEHGHDYRAEAAAHEVVLGERQWSCPR